jgi:hypothetical protein
MRGRWLLGGWLVLACGLAGCRKDPQEAVLEEVLAVLEDTGTVLKSVKDQAGMAAARSRLKQLYKRAAAIQKKQAALALRSPGDNPRLAETYGPKIEAAHNRNQAEIRRILNSVSGGKEFFDDLGKPETLK